MMKQVSADFLLVDVSNSFTKLAFASRARVGRAMRIPTAELSTKRLDQILRKGGARTIVACSVVPKKNRKIEQAAGNRRIIWLTPNVRLNVRINYPNLRSIALNRLANAVIVIELYGSPAIWIDFGIAVTFYIVLVDRVYIFGLLAPGLEAMP